MAKALYVGNLPWSVTEEDLRQLFTTDAQVEVDSVRLVTDRETGRSRGFGFVEVPEQSVERAIEALNGVEFGGRTLTVNEAKPREERSRRY
jgi:RNA recognition motif-containing protein